MDGTFLPEADWHYLLGEIHNHQVIPIVGPEMVTVREPSTGISIPLYRALAPKLAAALAVPTNGAPATSLNRVACDYLLSGGARKAIYGEVAELLERMEFTPPCCTLRAGVDYRFHFGAPSIHCSPSPRKVRVPAFNAANMCERMTHEEACAGEVVRRISAT